MKMKGALLIIVGMIIPSIAWSAPGIPLLTVTPGAHGAETYTMSLQILVGMTILTVLPAVLLMMTAFTRIAIVLSIVRQAIGLQHTPTNQIIVGLSLFLTFFVMSPIFNQVYETAVLPYMEEKISQKTAIENAQAPIRKFMLNQTRDSDLKLFLDLSGVGTIKSLNEVPFSTLLPAFVTSELKTAFQIGFLLFLPFLIIDIIVASALMSMGMMMLSPMIISLPFKILLFVLVDGWVLILGSLASSFGMSA